MLQSHSVSAVMSPVTSTTVRSPTGSQPSDAGAVGSSMVQTRGSSPPPSIPANMSGSSPFMSAPGPMSTGSVVSVPSSPLQPTTPSRPATTPARSIFRFK